MMCLSSRLLPLIHVTPTTWPLFLLASFLNVHFLKCPHSSKSPFFTCPSLQCPLFPWPSPSNFPFVFSSKSHFLYVCFLPWPFYSMYLFFHGHFLQRPLSSVSHFHHAVSSMSPFLIVPFPQCPLSSMSPFFNVSYAPYSSSLMSLFKVLRWLYITSFC